MGSLLSANLSFGSSGLYQFSKNKQENYDKEACTWLVGSVLVNELWCRPALSSPLALLTLADWGRHWPRATAQYQVTKYSLHGRFAPEADLSRGPTFYVWEWGVSLWSVRPHLSKNQDSEKMWSEFLTASWLGQVSVSSPKLMFILHSPSLDILLSGHMLWSTRVKEA